MKLRILNLLLTSFTVLICIGKNYSQDSSQTAPEFLVGAFIASIHPPYGPVTLHTNYDQIIDCGFNSVWQKARKSIIGNDSTNLNQLAQFGYVYAANDSGSEGTLRAKVDEYIDWISYFTQAKYTRWEAEGSTVFTGNDPDERNDIMVKHEFGEEFNDGNISGWASGTNQSDTGKFLIKGPDYWQWPRYSYTNPGWNPDRIDYKAVFRMKIDSPSGEQLPVCEILVTQSRYDEVTKMWILKDTLFFPGNPKVITLTTNDLDTVYKDFIIPYNYVGYFDLPEGDASYPSPPTLVSSPFEEMGSRPTMNEGSQVQFKVKWMGNRELFVDYVEVYDQRIWEYYFKIHLDWMIDSIYNYNQYFKSQNLNFYNKLKYYGTIDEPHVIDCYEPLRKVQFILDSLNINADLLTHWYPGWDGFRDADPTWSYYYDLAQPKKLMFWYSPFVNEPENNYNPNPRDFTLYWLQQNLQQAHLQQKDFYVTLQTWGTKNITTGNYEGYMYPTPEEISAETMLSLSHGVTGIFYEVYYSFFGNEDHTILYEALVDVPENSFQTTGQWNKVKEIASRLNGMLGKTLMELDYSDYYLMLRRYVHQSNETGNFTENWLTLTAVTENTPPPLSFHAGILENPDQADNKYFLLTNLITTDNRQVNISVTDNGSNFINTRFNNVEPGYGFDTTFTDEFSIDIPLPAGEGYLFQVAPVVEYGGRLLYNESVGGSLELNDDMIIENGATLTIYDNYIAKANIIVKNGSVVNGENGKIIFKNGKKLIINGTAAISGTAENKLTFEFETGGPETENGIVVEPGASLTISYCVVTDAETGIKALVNAGGVNVQYVDFNNCVTSAVTLLGQTSGPETVRLVKHCTITSSEKGISVTNLPEIIIQYNIITNTVMGIYLSNVADAQVINNQIHSNREEMSGIYF
jgi:hypothetical protein